MKTSLKLFLATVLLALIFPVLFVNAQESPLPDIPEGSDNGLVAGVEKIGGMADKFSDEEEGKEYLKQEWEKILLKKESMKPFFGVYYKFSPYTDPVFKYILGMAPSLSWFFLLTLVIWIFLLIYTFRITSLFEISSSLVHYIIVVIVMGIVSFFGVARRLSEYTINMISLAENLWMQLILVVVIILILIIGLLLSKNFQNLFKNLKKSQEKTEEELNRKMLRQDVEVAEEFRKAVVK